MEIVTIRQIYRNSESKDGKPFIGKDGKPYEKIAIRCVEYGDEYLTGFSSKWNQFWKVGDKVEVEIENVFKDGKKFMNIRPPDKMGAMAKQIEEIHKMVYELWKKSS